MQHQTYFVYILTNADRHPVLYTDVTNALKRWASEHSLGLGSTFARQCAIAREKQLRRWNRAKKAALIARRNPEWRDLFDEMYALRPVGGTR